MDQLIGEADKALRTVSGLTAANRAYPGESTVETVTRPEDRRHAAALMRVNHAGEVAAQALYHGQAFGAGREEVRESLLQAAQDETDHLAWCATRIEELGGRTSLLTPVWYAGSFAIGALAALAGDRYSLGFVAETERQVVEHLESHLQILPPDDARSRSVVEQMQRDEARHGLDAEGAGGAPLPAPIRSLMRLTARIMTGTAYWI